MAACRRRGMSLVQATAWACVGAARRGLVYDPHQKRGGHSMSFTISAARLEFMLQEDSPYGDLTTQGLGIGELHGRLSMTAGR